MFDFLSSWRGVKRLQEEESWINLKVIAVSAFLGYTGWVIKAVFDSLILYEKPFFDILIYDVPPSEVYIRVFVCICFFIFGVFLSKNIIQRKKAEEELKNAHDALTAANEELENKVKDRTEKIEKLLNEKDELIIQLGHDLKTPLTPLMGLLPSVVNKERDPELKELLEISIKNIHYIRDMVSKTIDLARLDSNLTEFNFENTNLLSEIDKVISNNQFIFDNKEIFVENKVDNTIMVKADKLRLREVFSNLLTNAVKYTPENGGMITIDAKKENEYIVISVMDTGLGLKKEHIDHVFDELYKVDSARHDLNSNGLGLPICKRIVEKHGGRIWLESLGEGKGTTVFFTVPLSAYKKKDN